MMIPDKRIAFDCSLISNDKFSSGLWIRVVGISGEIGNRRFVGASSFSSISRGTCMGVGGRYDLLISHFEEEYLKSPNDILPTTNLQEKDKSLSAVGITISLDNIIEFYQKKPKQSPDSKFTSMVTKSVH